MPYYYTKRSPDSFEIVEQRLRESIHNQGFDIITEIDVQQKMKEKLNINQQSYKIFGACNPQYAHQVLTSEPNIGVLLPCNVIIYENNNEVVISAVLPTASLGKSNNSKLLIVTAVIENMLKAVVDEAVNVALHEEISLGQTHFYLNSDRIHN